MWTIRKASHDDIDDLTELRLRFLEEIGYAGDGVQEVLREHLEQAIPTGEFIAWVAEEDGRIIATGGMVFLQKPPHGRNLSGREGLVLNMYTLPRQRGRGIGTTLMETIIEFVRQSGVTCIRLHASEDGVGIYSSVGFRSDNSEMFLYLSEQADPMKIGVLQVDAFTDQPFKGNPAAVCLLTEPKDDQWMQAVASEMNLSETAFLLKGANGVRLRWFTPKIEVDLCGHATLASAHVLWTEGQVSADEEIHFNTNSGLLKARCRDEMIELDFPVEPESEAAPPPGLLEALGVSATYVGKNRFDYLVEVASEEELRTIAPDFARLGRIEVRGVIVTSRSASREYDFVSRFFAPWAGIDEDPVTGSAHCCLGPYWQKRSGKSDFVAYQASARGGVVHVRVEGERICLGGKAVTVLRGELVEQQYVWQPEIRDDLLSHSSEYALGVYRAFGFVESGPPEIKDGVIATPMEYELPKT